jgi:hypothetical protein
VPPEAELPADELPAELEDGALTEDGSAASAPAAEGDAASAELVAVAVGPATPSSDQIAAAADVLVTVRTRRQLAAAITWNAMIAIAVLLTVASIILIVAGALGAHL